MLHSADEVGSRQSYLPGPTHRSGMGDLWLKLSRTQRLYCLCEDADALQIIFYMKNGDGYHSLLTCRQAWSSSPAQKRGHSSFLPPQENFLRTRLSLGTPTVSLAYFPHWEPEGDLPSSQPHNSSVLGKHRVAFSLYRHLGKRIFSSVQRQEETTGGPHSNPGPPGAQSGTPWEAGSTSTFSSMV